MKHFACAISLLGIVSNSSVFATPATGDLPVKLRVTVRERPGEAAIPMKNIGGFVIMRDKVNFTGGRCPDNSDEQGEIVCYIRCSPDDRSPRLSIVPPPREKERGLAPYHLQTSPPTLILKDCVVTSAQPVEFRYRSDEVWLSELSKVSPEVFSAISMKGGPTSAVRPLSDSKEALGRLAKNPKYKAALIEFSDAALARTSSLSAASRKADVLSEYGYGIKSILLQQQTKEAKIENPELLVPISGDHAQFMISLENVSNTLERKSVFTGNQGNLDKTIRELKRIESKQIEPFGAMAADPNRPSWPGLWR